MVVAGHGGTQEEAPITLEPVHGYRMAIAVLERLLSRLGPCLILYVTRSQAVY